MTNQQLYKTLLEFAKQGNCFIQKLEKYCLLLMTLGGTQNITIEILKN